MNTLGKIVRDYRKNHGISMAKFAEISDLSKSYISMLENNKDPRGNPIAPRQVEQLPIRVLGKVIESRSRF